MAIDSARGADHAALLNGLQEICENLKLSSTVVDIDGRPVFFVAYKSELKPELAYISQLETFEHGPASHWKDTGFNPLLPTMRDSRLYGLGASTGKADFAAKLKALAQCRASGAVAIGCLMNQISKSEVERLWSHLGATPKHILMGTPSDLHRIDWSTREMTLTIQLPRPDKEKAWIENHLLEENTITQTRFFSGKEWIPRIKSYISQLPSSAVILKLATTCNEFGYAVDGEIELDLSGQFSPSGLERVQNTFSLISQLETELASEAETRSGLGLGKITSRENEIEIEVIIQATQTVRKPVMRVYLDQIQRRLEEWGGKVSLKDFSPMFQFSSQSKFVETVDGLVSGVRSERFQFRQVGFEGVDMVAIGPGSSDFDQLVESVPFDQVERASEIYKAVGERILQ